jgi:phosphatidylserine/phosphatidylglycerophosphate/cardiolipin synthase-like enzyme
MKNAIIVILLGIFSTVYAQRNAQPDIEIVESIPIETSLDNPDIRNAHEVWLEMIGQAKYSLDIEQFYISNEPGKLLESVLTAICKAADNGVKVRIIADTRMYKTYPESVDGLGHHMNIETRKINFGKIAGGIQHAKYFIGDKEIVFMGSQNFDWRALEHIHELGLRINNKDIASAYGNIFDLDWKYAGDTSDAKHPPLASSNKYSVPIRIAVGGKDTAVIYPTFSPIRFIPESSLWDETAIIKLIDNSKQSLILQFLSYSTIERRGDNYTVIDDAIRRAAKRGVKVRMIVSDWEKGSPTVQALKDLAAILNIEVAFTSIPEWSGGYISFARVEHCKFIVADDKDFWLGTSNCERNYYYSSRNLGIVGKSSSLAKTLSKIFLKSWESPYKELITMYGDYKARYHGEKQ